MESMKVRFVGKAKGVETERIVKLASSATEQEIRTLAEVFLVLGEEDVITKVELVRHTTLSL